MPTKKPVLGTPLGDLLSASVLDETAPDTERLLSVSIKKIQPGRYQPRHDIDPETLTELSQSIVAQGIVQPLILRSLPAGGYEIIAGERRWRAAKLAGLTEVPAVIRDVTNEAALAMALIENIQREDLNPIDEALALQRLMNEFGLTHQVLAQQVGRSRTAVSNLLRLLALNEEVKQLLVRGQIEMGHARALLALKKPEQREVALKIVNKQWSVRQTEQWVRQILAQEQQEAPESKALPVDHLTAQLQQKLGKKVAIAHSASGKGKVVIHYNSMDELDQVVAEVVGKSD